MNNDPSNQRRKFIKNAMAMVAVAGLSPQLLNGESIQDGDYLGKDENNYTFLFQGDSITDGNRSRNDDWNHVMGHGYQYIIASKLWYDFPDKGFHFFNRGISGNKVTDLAARWQKDTLDIKPNLLSILIGINDCSAFLNGNKDFTAGQYEKDYRALLDATKQQLPDIQFVLCEPFILPVGMVKEKWDDYSVEVAMRGEIVRKLSIEFNAVFVPFQRAFNNVLHKAPAAYWMWDGIHPMPAGHELMAREWLHEVRKTVKLIR